VTSRGGFFSACTFDNLLSTGRDETPFSNYAAEAGFRCTRSGTGQ